MTETESSTTAQAPPAAAEGEAAAPLRDTHFDFEHKVFQIGGGFFAPDPNTKEPVLNIMLGDLKASLPFNTLRESFDIAEDSRDANLLGVVEKGLHFVKQIRPGEKIPGELLDGTASWSVDDRHRIIARGRITVQIVSWITGSEMIVVDLEELEQIVEDPQTKERLKTAFKEIAEKLGMADNAEQAISNRIDDLTQELSYIEALRDRFRHMRMIAENLNTLAKIYRTDRTLVDEMARMQGLIKKPLRQYDQIFEQADAQTGEIIGALKDFPTTVGFIRKIRDDLRGRLMEWEELLQAWDGVPIERSGPIEHLLKATYRFLASRFIETKVWKRK